MWWRSQSGIIHVVSIAAFTYFLIKLFTLDFVFIGFVRKSPHTKKKGSLPCRFVALNWTMTVSPYLTLIAPSVNRKEHTNVSLRRTLAIHIDQLNKCTNSHWYNIIHVFHSSHHLWRNPDLFDQNDEKNEETTFLGMLHQLSPRENNEGILGCWPGYVNFSKVILEVVIKRKNSWDVRTFLLIVWNVWLPQSKQCTIL